MNPYGAARYPCDEERQAWPLPEPSPWHPLDELFPRFYADRVAIGAAAGAFCAYQLYPAEMNDWEVRHLGAGVTIGLLVWVTVAFPFAWLGDRIDPSPKGEKGWRRSDTVMTGSRSY